MADDDHSAERDAAFLKSFKSVYALASPFQGPGGAGFAALYARGRRVTADARALIKMFEDVKARVERVDGGKMLGNAWTAEDESARELLERGRRVGIERYAAGLGGERGEGKRVFGEGEVGVWGKVARKQEKAARRLVKTLG